MANRKRTNSQIMLNKTRWNHFKICGQHFQQLFRHIVAGSFIGGGNRMTLIKPPTCRKSVTNLITQCCTPLPDRDTNSQHQW
jgi:hypothetical protein